MALQDQQHCHSQGWAYSPSANMCVYTGGKDGSTQYYDPTTLQPATAPTTSVSDLVWPGSTAYPAAPVSTMGSLPQSIPAAAPDFFSGIGSFLTTAPFLGIPNWVLIAAAIGGIVIFANMDSGGRKKKSDGWF